MALLPCIPHYGNNATAEDYLEYALKGRDPQFVLQSARMVNCLQSFCRSCTQEQFSALALMPAATVHLPLKHGARKRRSTRPAAQPLLRPLAKAKPRFPSVSLLAPSTLSKSQQQSYPSIPEQVRVSPGGQHWKSRLPQQEHSISLSTPPTLPIQSGEEGQTRHPGPPSYYFRERADANTIVKQLENSFQPADKIIRAPLFENIWSAATLLKPNKACADEHPTVESRLRRLLATYQEIGRIKQHHALGSRILILMMRHEKEVLISEFSGSLRKGQRLDSYANEQIAQEWKIDERKVNHKFMQAKRYLALIRRGPGCLLYVKSSTWETKLKDDQVESLCQYFGRVREYLTQEGLEKSVEPGKAKAMLKMQNFCTAKLIIESLLHFGWTHEKLAKSGTNLVKALGDYVDLLALEQGRICDKSGRDFQSGQEYEVDGQDGTRGDNGGQGEVGRHDDRQDDTSQTLDAHADHFQACKRRRIDSGPTPNQGRGHSDQQRKTSLRLHCLPSLQGIDANGQPLQHEKNTGQPRLRSSAHSDIPGHVGGALHPRDAGGLDHDHAGMYSLDVIPNIDFAWIDWSNLNYDSGCVYSTAALPNIDFAEGDWNNI